MEDYFESSVTSLNPFFFPKDKKTETLRQNLRLSLAKDKALQMELEMIDLQNQTDDAVHAETVKRLQYERAKM